MTPKKQLDNKAEDETDPKNSGVINVLIYEHHLTEDQANSFSREGLQRIIWLSPLIRKGCISANEGKNLSEQDVVFLSRAKELVAQGLATIKELLALPETERTTISDTITNALALRQREQRGGKLLRDSDLNMQLVFPRKKGVQKRIDEFKEILCSYAEQCDEKTEEKIKATFNEMKNLLENLGLAININDIRNSRNETLLMLVSNSNISSSNKKFFNDHDNPVCKTIKLLLQYGADPLATSNDGRTALMEAANAGRIPVIDLLLDNIPPAQRIAHINQADLHGITAERYAGRGGRLKEVNTAVKQALAGRITKEAETQIPNPSATPKPKV